MIYGPILLYLIAMTSSICLALAGGNHAQPPDTESVAGLVVGGNGPQAGAIVRVQTTDRFTVTDTSGRFELDVSEMGSGPFDLTAWAEGYFCSGPVAATAGDQDIRIDLRPIPHGDNRDYVWISAEALNGAGENQGCVACHSRGDDLGFTLPVDEWRSDAHSASATSPRFLTMYLGTDMEGRSSPVTRQFSDPEYGTLPLPPEAGREYFGPGYKLDFPDSAGNCATCHAPVAAMDAPYQADPTVTHGVAAEGVTCDFCHKISEVILDPDVGLPYHDRPGVLSFLFQRPRDGHQFFAGPFDDVAPGEDTYSPLQRESRFCAPCHFGSFWGTVIYNSFGEWLDSPYSDPETGQTCQDCHMPDTGGVYFARPDRGGLRREATPLPSHRMPGAADNRLLENAVSLDLKVERAGGSVVATVTITNDQTGHHVPTDSPLRHLILIVSACNQDGRPLDLVAGGVIPEWGGMGDREDGNYAGLPGKAFAKVLMEEWTKVVPSGAYWNPTRVILDNRIPALGVDRSRYRFSAGDHESVRVSVELIFRRAFKKLMDQKGWSDPDLMMETASVVLKQAPRTSNEKETP
jgi:mono/diheme cytochrome c family protein